MARFPRTEAEVIALAEAMITGLTANTVLYPAPQLESCDGETAAMFLAGVPDIPAVNNWLLPVQNELADVHKPGTAQELLVPRVRSHSFCTPNEQEHLS